MDELDLAIMRLLQDDGRKSFTEIAKALEVSVGTVRNRMSRLIENGVLHIFARVDPKRVGFNAAANIHIAIRPPALIDKAVNEIANFPEVSYMVLLTGEFDIEIDVMCRDQAHLLELLTQRLHKIEGVVDARTHPILRVYKYSQPDLSLLSSDQPTLPESNE